MYVWKKMFLSTHAMNIRIWSKIRVWQWYESHVNRRNASLVRRVLSLVLFWVFTKIFWSLLFYPFLISAFWFITLILNGYLLLLSFSFLDDSEAYHPQTCLHATAKEPSTEGVIQWWTMCQLLPMDTSEAAKVAWIWWATALDQYTEPATWNHVPLECTSAVVREVNHWPHPLHQPSTWSCCPKVGVRSQDVRCWPPSSGCSTAHLRK
jgi:hypothetical protein